MASLGEQELGLLKAFVAGCKSNPSLLHQPELDFFKDYLESLGGKQLVGVFALTSTFNPQSCLLFGQ